MVRLGFEGGGKWYWEFERICGKDLVGDSLSGRQIHL